MNRNAMGWTSLLLSVLLWFFIFKGLFYWMYYIENESIRFPIFEEISLSLSIIPIIIGIIGLVRKEKLFSLSVVGIIISSLTFFGLIAMILLNGI
jgi:hypothetical protein